MEIKAYERALVFVARNGNEAASLSVDTASHLFGAIAEVVTDKALANGAASAAKVTADKVSYAASKGAAKAAFKTLAKHIGKGLLPRVAAAVLAVSMIAGGTAGSVTQVSAVESFPVTEIPGTVIPDTNSAEQNENEQLNLAYEAYLGYLQDHRKDIDQYNWQTTWRSGQIVSEPGQTVAIADIMGDDIPELIYMQAGANTLVNLYIVTYRDGDLAWVYSDDSTFWDGQAGGGFNYYLFRVKDDTALYGYLRPAFESDGSISCSRFNETAAGALERIPICEEIIHAGFNGNEYVETHNYRVDGKDSTEDGYAQKMEEIKLNITEIFQHSLPIAGEGESLSNRFDLQTMVQVMTCEEAIQYLRGCIGSDTGQAETIDVAALPASLNAFLKQFSDWYWDATGTWENGFANEYDCAHAADGTSNILAGIVNHVTPSCVDFSLYPGVMPEEHFEGDPRGWSEYGWYVVYDGPTVDWVAKNIFNITDEEISALLTQGENQRLIYKDNTSNGSYQYYAPIAGGIGDPMTEIRLKSAEFDGQKYYVAYDVYFAGVPNANPPIDAAYRGSYYAELEEKTIDDQTYWSMYKNVPESENPDDAAAVGTPVSDLFAQIPLVPCQEKLQVKRELFAESMESHSAGPNLMDTRPQGKDYIFQIDGNLGSTAAIAEMLVQSDEDRVLLLPALPGKWAKGRIAEPSRLSFQAEDSCSPSSPVWLRCRNCPPAR